ncbi:hypothetical protein ACXPWS_09175 [Mycobacterium sp. BMJ-28]
MPENDEQPTIPKYPTGLKARGKRLWRELHAAANFDGCPETRIVVEEACYLTDEIERLRRLVRKAGPDTRVSGYNGQPVSMPEVDDLRKNQSTLLAMLKSLRLPDDGDGKLTRSEIGKMGAAARWDQA